MDSAEFDYLCKCMIKAKANDDLEDIEIISFPHLKDSKTRNKVKLQIEKRAETEEQLEEKIITTDQLNVGGQKIGNISDFVKG